LFGLFDDDGNGEISIQELMILLSAVMDIDEASNPEFMNDILKKIDKDESGKYACIITRVHNIVWLI